MADEADTLTAASAAEVEETGNQDAGRDPLSEMKTKSVENAMKPLIDQVSSLSSMVVLTDMQLPPSKYVRARVHPL